jgi:CheY-like chemotaxis protein
MVEKMKTAASHRILLVEDNPAHAELIMRSLEEQVIPTDIYHVSDGEKALDYLFQRKPYDDQIAHPRPHIVLLDIRMPKVDGIEVLKEIKFSEELKHIPVIILTTSEAEKDVRRAYKYYANSYLVKPVDFDKFLQLMAEIGSYWLNWNYPQLA